MNLILLKISLNSLQEDVNKPLMARAFLYEVRVTLYSFCCIQNSNELHANCTPPQIVDSPNDIDVDKWDYFTRDCHYLGLQHGFDLGYC